MSKPESDNRVGSSAVLGRLRAHILQMAPHQKERTGGKLLVEASDALGQEIITRATALSFLVNNIEEIKNQIGGVIGYRLQLNAEQTEELWRILDMTGRPNDQELSHAAGDCRQPKTRSENRPA